MVSSLEEVVLVNSMLAVLLAMVVALITKIWRNPYVAHALWLLVLAKLITPPIVPVTLWEMPSSRESISVVHQVAPEFEHELASTSNDIVNRKLLSPPVSRDSVEASVASEVHLRSDVHLAGDEREFRDPFRLATTFVIAAWCLGAIYVLINLALERRRVRRIIRLARPARGPLQSDIHRICRRIGVGSVPETRVVEAAISPMVWVAAWCPVLLLPKGLLEGLSQSQRGLGHRARADSLKAK